jgi:hypothetical protein
MLGMWLWVLTSELNIPSFHFLRKYGVTDKIKDKKKRGLVGNGDFELISVTV